MSESESPNREELATALMDALATAPADTPEPVEAQAVTAARRRRRLVRTAAAAWLLLAGLWVVRPPAVFEPAASLAAAPPRDEAGLRYAMYLQAGRVDEFIDEHGRLPGSLAETGDVEEGVHWERQGPSGWILTGEEGDLRLTLTDAMAADSFLGTSIGTIRRR